VAAPAPPTVEALVAAKEIAVVCGPGGVGKTTVAASIAAMAAWHHGGRVLVLTVDPARRLAQALGLTKSQVGAAGDAHQAAGAQSVQPTHPAAGAHLAAPAQAAQPTEPPAQAVTPAQPVSPAQEVPLKAPQHGPGAPRGELWAEVLDTKRAWDELVSRHAPDAVTARRILANPLYQDISGRFIQSHDYIAVERLYELHNEGNYDLIVVDTPPTRSAVDFLLAPERMADFFSSRLLRLLAVPYRSRLLDMAARPFYYVADRVLGSQFLEDIAEFFILFQTLSDGFVARAHEVERLLADRRTTFIVVSTLEPAPVREAEAFMGLLPGRHLHLGALVLNKVLPGYLMDPGLAERAEQLAENAAEIAASLTASGAALEGGDASLVERVLSEVASNFNNLSVVAKREGSQRAELPGAPSAVVAVPELDEDVHDLPGVLRVGRALWS
jgi:anion-transporting  ArsA/GET3 family ATPase